MSNEVKPVQQIKFNIYNNITDFEDNFLDDFENSDLSEKHFVNYLTENYEQIFRNLTKTEIWKPEHGFLDTYLLSNFFYDNDVKDLSGYKQSQSFVYITNKSGETIAHVYKPLIDFFNEKNQLDLFSFRELINNLKLIIKRLEEIGAGLSVKSLPEILGIEAESDKIILNGNPQILGYLFTELINKGYISAPTIRGKLSPQRTVKMLLKHFDYADYDNQDETSKIEYLRKTIGEQNSVSQDFADRLQIPFLSQFIK